MRGVERWFAPLVFFVAGLAAGAAAYALIGPYRQSIDPVVQSSLATIVGAIIAAFAAGVGVLTAARVGAREAAAGREDERRDGFRDQTRVLAADLLRESSAHEKQVADEVSWRSTAGNSPWELGHKPHVGSTEPLAAAAYELRITSQLPETANQARRVYHATVALDAFAFTPATDLVDDRHVQAVDEQRLTDFHNQRATLHAERRTFVRLVRGELGRHPFEDEWDQ